MSRGEKSARFGAPAAGSAGKLPEANGKRFYDRIGEKYPSKSLNKYGEWRGANVGGNGFCAKPVPNIEPWVCVLTASSFFAVEHEDDLKAPNG